VEAFFIITSFCYSFAPPEMVEFFLVMWDACFLLRYPANATPDEAGEHSADRCHSLGSLAPPQAALASLPTGHF
jgi:hypothetical protein